MAIERFSTRMSDRFYMVASRLLVAPDDETYYVIQVPRFALVTDVFLFVSKAYVAGTPSIEVGFTGNKDTAVVNYFITNDVAEPKVTGIKRSVTDTRTSNSSKYFNNGSGAITVTIAAGSATTEGNFEVFANYVIIS